jgi:hypothetical protein
LAKRGKKKGCEGEETVKLEKKGHVVECIRKLFSHQKDLSIIGN